MSMRDLLSCFMFMFSGLLSFSSSQEALALYWLDILGESVSYYTLETLNWVSHATVGSLQLIKSCVNTFGTLFTQHSQSYPPQPDNPHHMAF